MSIAYLGRLKNLAEEARRPEPRRQQCTYHDQLARKHSDNEDRIVNRSFAEPEIEDHICWELLSTSAVTNPDTRIAWAEVLHSVSIERAAVNDHHDDRGLIFDPDHGFEVGEDERCFRSEYNTKWRRYSFMGVETHDNDHERKFLAADGPSRNPTSRADCALEYLFDDRSTSNIRIHTSEFTLHVHREVTENRSSFFRNQFIQDGLDTQQRDLYHDTDTIPHHNPIAVWAWARWCYTPRTHHCTFSTFLRAARPTISLPDYRALLHAALYYQMSDLALFAGEAMLEHASSHWDADEYVAAMWEVYTYEYYVSNVHGAWLRQEMLLLAHLPSRLNALFGDWESSEAPMLELFVAIEEEADKAHMIVTLWPDWKRDGVHGVFEEAEWKREVLALGGFFLGRSLRFNSHLRFRLKIASEKREVVDRAEGVGDLMWRRIERTLVEKGWCVDPLKPDWSHFGEVAWDRLDLGKGERVSVGSCERVFLAQ